jgi:quercetin dioxygenase-like cupin family protein
VGAAADSPPLPTAGVATVGTLPGPAKVKQDGVELKIREDATVRTFDLTYAPGADSGWHAHPGIVIAVVREGTVKRRAGCEIETFSKGASFTEVGPHRVTNPSSVDAVLSITQIFPADSPAARVPADPPTCPPRHHHRR